MTRSELIRELRRIQTFIYDAEGEAESIARRMFDDDIRKFGMDTASRLGHGPDGSPHAKLGVMYARAKITHKHLDELIEALTPKRKAPSCHGPRNRR